MCVIARVSIMMCECIIASVPDCCDVGIFFDMAIAQIINYKCHVYSLFENSYSEYLEASSTDSHLSHRSLRGDDLFRSLITMV